MINDARLDRVVRAATRQVTSRGDTATELVVPSITEFVTSPHYLGCEAFYPRQATFLKLVFLGVDELTDFDRGVVDEWRSGFRLKADADGRSRYVGDEGICPDVYQRVERLRDEEAPWFHEAIAAAGRRGSKGWLGGVMLARVLWTYLAFGDPHEVFRIERGKRLNVSIFAANKDQAAGQQFRDLKALLHEQSCFAPFVAKRTNDTVLLWTPAQLADGVRDPEDALIEVVARQATGSAGRGPASFALAFDEFAHMTATDSIRSAEEVFRGALPATAQFGEYAFIYEASSPYQKIGRFYENYEAGLEVDESGFALRYNTLVAQWPSWEKYLDWQRTHDGLEMRPGGPPFPVLVRATLEPDAPDVQAARRDNYDAFAVEYLAHWANVLDQYLPTEHVRRVFGPWLDRPLEMIEYGQHGTEYHAHCDLARVGANVAFVIAHRVEVDATSHVIIDHIRVWKPREFPEGRIDYNEIERELLTYIDRFRIVELTFDQYQSAGLIDRLNEATRGRSGWGRISIHEVTATHGRNWSEAELFKVALSRALVHCPRHELAEQELLFLHLAGTRRVDHQSSGPCTTSDIADCLFGLTYRLLAGPDGLIAQLGTTRLRGAARGGFPLSHTDQTVFNALSAFGGPAISPHAARPSRRPRTGRRL